MAKRYIRINFQNAPSTASPLSAETLNEMDKGIDDLDNAIEDLYDKKIDKTSIIQTTATNDSAKVPSSAVTYGLQQSINTLNNNLNYNYVKKAVTISNQDINNIKTTGFYYGYNVINSANSEISVFKVQRYTDDWIYQEQIVIKADGTATRYYRTFYNGSTWGTWIQF